MVAFVPDDTTGSKLIVEVIAAPDDVIPADPLQLPEVFWIRDVPFVGLVIVHPVNSCCAASFPIETASLRTGIIRRVNDSEIEGFIRKRAKYLQTVAAMKCYVS